MRVTCRTRQNTHDEFDRLHSERLREVLIGEATRRQPRIMEAVKSIPSEKEKSAEGRKFASRVFDCDSQIAQCCRRQFRDRWKHLGSSSEVERFRVQIRDGLFVKQFEF
jgi:hypothetical protein